MSLRLSFLIALAAILVSLCLSVVGNTIKPKAIQKHSFTDQDLTDNWEVYKTKFHKKYNKEEEKKHFITYLDNKKRIKEHNDEYEIGLTTYNMAENQFSDWTKEEYKMSLTGKPRGVREINQLLKEEWGAYKTKYNKKYSREEDEERFNIYLESKRKVEAHNADYDNGLTTYRQGLNAFADLKPEELSARLGFRKH